MDFPHRWQKDLRRGSRFGIIDYGDLPDIWCDLLEQFDPLGPHRRLFDSETGDAAAGPFQTSHEALRDRIGNRDHDYRKRSPARSRMDCRVKPREARP